MSVENCFDIELQRLSGLINRTRSRLLTMKIDAEKAREALQKSARRRWLAEKRLRQHVAVYEAACLRAWGESPSVPALLAADAESIFQKARNELVDFHGLLADGFWLDDRGRPAESTLHIAINREDTLATARVCGGIRYFAPHMQERSTGGWRRFEVRHNDMLNFSVRLYFSPEVMGARIDTTTNDDSWRRQVFATLELAVQHIQAIHWYAK